MYEITLSKPKKIWFTILLLFCIIGAIGTLQLTATEKLPPAARIGLLMCAAFCAAWSVFFVRMLRRGTMRRQIDPPTAAGMGFVFALSMCILFAVSGMPTDKVLLAGFFFMLPAGLVLIRTVVEQSEIRTQERIVELEYKIARLSEKLGGDDDDQLSSGVLR